MSVVIVAIAVTALVLAILAFTAPRGEEQKTTSRLDSLAGGLIQVNSNVSALTKELEDKIASLQSQLLHLQNYTEYLARVYDATVNATNYTNGQLVRDITAIQAGIALQSAALSTTNQRVSALEPLVAAVGSINNSVGDIRATMIQTVQSIDVITRNLSLGSHRVDLLNDSLSATAFDVMELQSNTSALQSALSGTQSLISNQSREIEAVKNITTTLTPASSGFACSNTTDPSQLCLRWVRTPRTLTLLSDTRDIIPNPTSIQYSITWRFHLADFADSNRSLPVTANYWNRPDVCTISASITSTNKTSATDIISTIRVNKFPRTTYPSLYVDLWVPAGSPPWYGNLTLSFIAICPVKECTDPDSWYSPECCPDAANCWLA